MKNRVKVILVGDTKVGKTCLLIRLVKGKYYGDEKTTATIGTSTFSLNIKNNENDFIAMIWDTAGQERYESTVTLYFEGAEIAFIVYDTSNRETFKNVDKWNNLLENNTSHNLYKVLVANKSDLNENKDSVTQNEGLAKANELGMPFIFASAKTGECVSLIETEIKNGYKTLPKYQPDDKNRRVLSKQSNGCC